jgi:hypothetical protein
LTPFQGAVPHNRRVDDDRGTPPDAEVPGTDLPDAQLPRSTWAREGYDASEVDAFVLRLRQALRQDPPAMAPYEVVDERFKVTRFGRRYRLQEVDDLLDTGQRLLRERHGDDAVANLEGREPQPRHFPTGWIYAVALVLVAAMVLFAVTQL